MSRLSPTSTDNFTHSMSRGGDILETDSKNTEEKNLDGGARGIPEGTTDTVVPGNVGRLEKCGSPGPLGDNHRGSEASLDHATGGAVVLRR